ncbi:cell division protein FtsL [bacterium]|nr:cell division protein FtsL [bacterium]
MIKRYVPLWIIIPTVLFSLATVSLRLWIFRTTYAISQAERTMSNLREEKEVLQAQVATLRSPSHLENLARKKFKMAQPKPNQVVHLQ